MLYPDEIELCKNNNTHMRFSLQMADVAENAAFTDSATAISHGKRHLLVRDYTMAVTALAQACQLLAEKHGDTADELGEPYLLYGRALLGLAREEAGVLGGGVPGTEEAEEEDEEDEEEAEDEKLSNVDEKEEEEDEERKTSKSKEEGASESKVDEPKADESKTAEEPAKPEAEKKEEKVESSTTEKEKEREKEEVVEKSDSKKVKDDKAVEQKEKEEEIPTAGSIQQGNESR